MNGLRSIVLVLAAASSCTVPAFAQQSPSPTRTMAPMQMHMMAPTSTNVLPADRRMMRAMMGGAPHKGMMSPMVRQFDGKIDHDFLVMMLHHQEMALRLARYEAANGKDAATRTLAKSIAEQAEAQLAALRGQLHEP